MIITKSSLNITSESEERVSAPYTFFKLWDNLLVWYDERESAYQFLKKRNNHLEQDDFERILKQYILDKNRWFIGKKNTPKTRTPQDLKWSKIITL